jgi:hypothetical protein
MGASRRSWVPVNARSGSPTMIASNPRPGLVTASDRRAACRRRAYGNRLEQPTSKNSATIRPRPAITSLALSRGHPRGEPASWNSTVETRP